MQLLQAIETEYASIRFRSRLEARWALFFDHLGIKWAYEAEGYRLTNSDGYHPVNYLPDFRIIAQPMFPKATWFECKPSADGFGAFEYEKASRLAFHSNWRVGIIFQPESPQRVQFFTNTGTHWSYELQALDFKAIHPSGQADGYCFCECPKCGAIGFEYEGRADRIECGCNIPLKTLNNATPRILAGIRAALWERFDE